MRKITIADAVVSVLILILIAFALAPALARMHRTAAEAKCQSNLRRWAEALAVYTQDFDGRFPMNRKFGLGMTPGAPTQSVPLSHLGFDSDGNPIRYQYGFGWVEALYPYIIDAATKTDQDWLSFMKCPNATNNTYPPGSPARMTYVFNFCLTEQPRQLIRNPESLMMLREADRNLNSVCRPISTSCIANPYAVPQYPLLTEGDSYLHPIDPNLHGSGSYIVFADGHVKYFTTDFFPPQSYYTVANCWDGETQQWYNYGPGADMPPEYIKSIAITP